MEENLILISLKFLSKMNSFSFVRLKKPTILSFLDQDIKNVYQPRPSTMMTVNGAYTAIC
jgi:hypothetical protein